jgi:hypothetical protein
MNLQARNWIKTPKTMRTLGLIAYLPRPFDEWEEQEYHRHPLTRLRQNINHGLRIEAVAAHNEGEEIWTWQAAKGEGLIWKGDV